jgi:hypothetical protein
MQLIERQVFCNVVLFAISIYFTYIIKKKKTMEILTCFYLAMSLPPVRSTLSSLKNLVKPSHREAPICTRAKTKVNMAKHSSKEVCTGIVNFLFVNARCL